MQNADRTYQEFRGVAEHFPIKVGSITALVDAVIAEDSPYDILLGLPWIKHVNGALLIRNGEFVAEVCEPSNYHHKLQVTVSSHQAPLCHEHSAPVHMLLPVRPVLSVRLGELSARIIRQSHSLLHPSYISKKYKKVENKVRLVATTTPDNARVLCRWIDDPLASL
jgi:hypothetical protein